MAVMGAATDDDDGAYEDGDAGADEMPWTDAAAASWETFCLEMAELCDLCETFGIRLPRDLEWPGMAAR